MQARKTFHVKLIDTQFNDCIIAFKRLLKAYYEKVLWRRCLSVKSREERGGGCGGGGSEFLLRILE